MPNARFRLTPRPRRAPTRPRLRAALAAAAFALTLAAAAGGEEPTTSAEVEGEDTAPAIRWQPHRFAPADGEAVDAELGVLAVPENRDAAESRWIDLHFVRFKSTSKTPGSPIVYLAGGPGGSGINAAKGPRFPLFMALRARADVIALDQRGTGLSNAIPTCRFPEPPPFDRPAERGWVGDYMERRARHCAEFWAEEGVDLGGYDTAQGADDLEALRRALGAPQLSLWGISYGTHLAFSALDRHPKSFDRAILASAEGPDDTIKRPARTEALFAAVDARLDGTWLPTMRRAVDRLREEPAVVTASLPGVGDAKVGIGALDLQLIISWMIADPHNLARLVAWAPDLAAGDYSQLAPIVAGMRMRFQTLDGMSIATDAASGATPDRRRQIREQRGRALLGDALNFPMLPDWPVAEWLGIQELPDAFRRSPRSSVPALFLSGSLDGRTYTSSHRELAAGFSRASFVVVEGAGHNLFMSSPEVEARMLDFLARGETSEETIEVESFLD